MPTETEIREAAAFGLDLDWERKDREVGEISERYDEVRELDDGFEFRYPGGDQWATDLSRVQQFLQRHYPYFDIELRRGANDAPHWLRITGPDDAKSVLQQGLDYADGTATRDGSEIPSLRERLLGLGPRYLSAPLRMLPDFLVIGAAKAGTTSLYSYLSGHPAIGAAFRKELYFFDMKWSRGINYYRARFPTIAQKRRHERRHGSPFITGEATPCYMFHPHAARRARATVPHAKLIVSLRDPAERAYSHYCMNARRGVETLSFEEAIEREPERLHGELERMREDEHYFSLKRHYCAYLARGVYADQLQSWLEHFPRDQLLVLTNSQLKRDRQRTLARVQEFLGLPIRELPDTGRRNFIPYPAIEPHMARRLRDYFAPHDERLHALLGERPDWL